jgi:hypothetical protein
MVVRLARPALAVLLVGVLAGCGPDGPAIQEVSPAKGENNVAADAPIRVVFNHDMERASVESRLSLAPALEGCDQVACPLTWSGRALVLNHPLHPFAPDTRYRVSLRAGYRDSAGRAEGNDHFWEFHSESAPSIGTVTPGEGSTGVAVDADLSLQLSRAVLVPPVQELTLVGAGDPEPLQYRVAVAPDDSRRLVISPLALLRPRTAYTLHVGAGVSDNHHNTLGAGRDFHFTTGTADLARSLGFLVRDKAGQGASRVALLRPPAGLNSPAPSLRVLYHSDQPIASFAWSSDAARVYILGADGRVEVVPLDGTPAGDSGIVASALASSPAHPEVAYVAGGALHLWRPTAVPAGDLPVPQAGRVSGSPAWSGDGRRLAFSVDDGHGGLALRVLDRETLSVSEVGGGPLPSSGPVLAWSPDGSALAFTRAGGEVWSFRPLAAEGNGLLKLGNLEATALSWSSDGDALFAAGAAAGKPALLYRALGQPLDGQAAGFTAFSSSRGGDSDPAAPAFDRRLAFLRPAAGAPQAWIMNNDGTGVTQLTFAGYDSDERLPADGVDQLRWSPGTSGQ